MRALGHEEEGNQVPLVQVLTLHIQQRKGTNYNEADLVEITVIVGFSLCICRASMSVHKQPYARTFLCMC